VQPQCSIKSKRLLCERWVLGCGAVLGSFVHRLVLVVWLLGCVGISRGCLSLVSAISWLEASSVSRRGCACVGFNRRGWETILLIAMLLESSCSRLVPSKKAMLMACSITLEAWRSTIIEVSCSSLIARIIECKYYRAMMVGSRSCPSSERKAPNQPSSSIHHMLQSITIMIASSSLIVTIIEYNHGL